MNVADQHSLGFQVFPRAVLAVRLYPEFTNKLRASLEDPGEAGSPAESGGLLFGTTQEDVTTVRAFRPFTIWNQRQNNSPGDEHVGKTAAELSGAFGTGPDLTGSELVGWCYACEPGSNSTGLLERDIQFHNRHFPRPTDLILILNRGQEQGVSIELFALSSSAPVSPQEFRWCSFYLAADTPLNRPIDIKLEKRYRRDYLPEAKIATPGIPEGPANPRVLVPGAPSPRTNRLLSVASAALSVLAIAMTFAWAHTRAQYSALKRDSRSVRGQVALSSDLRMQAENSGDGVLLSWNRKAAAVRSAKQGILHIQDGSEERTIYLDPSDIASSSIVYMPDSKDARFRLELLGERGSAMSNTVRAPDGLKSAVEPDTRDDSREVTLPLDKPAPTMNPEGVPAYVPARALKEVLLDSKSFISWNVREETKVDVQLRIDEKGHVVEAHIKNGAQKNGFLRNAALEAAKQWIFEPAKSDGKNIASDHTIEFRFHP
ncbi:MAG: energy transducer TonB [Bryobacteraceae bacterium]